ncbi:unnamed protein product [Lymnaea stagnalis]|uniref:Solute carrier family 28 member 3 n=1 Tax=Lymnaea stagnalis TaxID=6523 RepID=A0AAV2ICM2_LYMST
MAQVKQNDDVTQSPHAVELQLMADGIPPAPSSDSPELERLSDSDDDESAPQDVSTCCAKWYFLRRRLYRKLTEKLNGCLRAGILVLCLCLFMAYFSYAMYRHHDSSSIVGLVVITVIASTVLVVRGVSRYEPLARINKFFMSHSRASRNLKRCVTFACVTTTCVTLVTEVILVRPENLVSLTGIAAIFLIFLMTSTHPHMISWQPVLSGFFLQYVLALAILRVPAVHSVFLWCGDVITLLVTFSKKGGEFIFGDLYRNNGFIFHFIPLVAFIIPLLAILEHLGVLDALLKIVGRFLAFCTGASPPEALNASANIFMGPIDSIMIIRPYLKDVTPSELHCLMANGMSTVTGSIMGVYIAFGISPDHLLAASVMSAPAALAVAKLAVPETRRRKDDGVAGEMLSHTTRYRSVMDAASSGAIASLALAGAVIANVTAVSSFIEMTNACLRWLGGLVDIRDFTLQRICSYLFYPLALALGVDSRDGRTVAELLGIKVFINEVIAYAKLGEYKVNRLKFDDYLSRNFTEWSVDDMTRDVFLTGWNETLKEGFISVRSEIITTYALCGFANFVSVGIIIGCYIVLVPHRKMVVFQYVLRSMFVGHCASFLTACIAGMFLS